MTLSLMVVLQLYIELGKVDSRVTGHDNRPTSIHNTHSLTHSHSFIQPLDRHTCYTEEFDDAPVSWSKTAEYSPLLEFYFHFQATCKRNTVSQYGLSMPNSCFHFVFFFFHVCVLGIICLYLRFWQSLFRPSDKCHFARNELQRAVHHC